MWSSSGRSLSLLARCGRGRPRVVVVVGGTVVVVAATVVATAVVVVLPVVVVTGAVVVFVVVTGAVVVVAVPARVVGVEGAAVVAAELLVPRCRRCSSCRTRSERLSWVPPPSRHRRRWRPCSRCCWGTTEGMAQSRWSAAYADQRATASLGVVCGHGYVDGLGVRIARRRRALRSRPAQARKSSPLRARRGPQ